LDRLKFPRPEEVASRAFEEQVYGAVADELSAGIRREGLWLKAIADGDEVRAKALYIKYRAQAILDDAYLSENQEEQTSKLDARLLKAALYGNLDELQECLSGGANVNVRNEHGATPLFLSALHGFPELARVLLDAGADPLIPNKSGKRPREVALANDHRDVAELLPAA